MLNNHEKMLNFIKRNNLATLIEALLLSSEEMRKYKFEFSVRVDEGGNVRLIPNSKVKDWLNA
jgi:hypothetical protein